MGRLRPAPQLVLPLVPPPPSPPPFVVPLLRERAPVLRLAVDRFAVAGFALAVDRLVVDRPAVERPAVVRLAVERDDFAALLARLVPVDLRVEPLLAVPLPDVLLLDAG